MTGGTDFSGAAEVLPGSAVLERDGPVHQANGTASCAAECDFTLSDRLPTGLNQSTRTFKV